MYCTYLTTYHGNLLPPYYIGSSSITKIQTGYRGSVSSAEFKEVWNNELLNNPRLFTVEIISTHETRKEALIAELEYQIMNNVVNDKLYVNKSLAQPDGFFGMDVSGSNNPMYGRSRKGEKHKGGENIAAALKKSYESGKHDHLKEASSVRFTENNPTHNPEIMERIKKTWKDNGRGIGSSNGMYGKKSAMNGKKLYNDGKVTKCFIENHQPAGWTLGRHTSLS